MRKLDEYEVILWDFDGVILDSMHIRDLGFERVLENFPREQVTELLRYHRANGGLSRYVKFRYFFEQIRNEEVTEEQVMEMAGSFSEIMLELLTDKSNLITDSVNYLQSVYQDKEMHIVSGSDQNELRTLCDSLEVAHFFESINGSPTPKTELVRRLTAGRSSGQFVLIGDSMNDFEAASANGIDFFGYNNPGLRGTGTGYIDKFVA